MKKIILPVLIIIFFICNHRTYAQNTWQAFDPFPWDPGGGSGLDEIKDIAFDSTNTPWVGEGYVNFNPRTIAHLNGTNWDTIDAPASIYNSYRALEFDHTGNLWMSGGNFAAKYASGNWTVYLSADMNLPASFNAIDLDVDVHNNVWILAITAADNYLVKYDGTSFTTISINAVANDSAGHYKNGLLSDTLGNIYITSPWADSIKVYDGSTFSQFNFFGFTPPSSWDISETIFDPSNNDCWIWLSESSSDSIQLVKCVTGNFYYTSKYLSPITFSWWDMTIDHQERVWLGTTTGIVEFDGTNWDAWTIPSALGAPTVTLWKIKADHEDNIWLCGQNVSNTLFKFNTSSPQVIKGNVYLDANGNGIKDSSETNLHNILVTQTPDNFYSNTSYSGNYALQYSDSALTYSVSAIAPQYWMQTSTPIVHSVNPSTQTTTGYDFGLQPIPNVVDVDVSVASWSPKPGIVQAHYFLYQNTGTVSVTDTLSYIWDPKFHYVLSYPPADSIDSASVHWIYTLAPDDSAILFLSLLCDTTAVIGDTLHSFATINPVMTDTTPANNVFDFMQVVVSALDPNEKIVSPDGNISNGQELSYTVFFQNTGTSSASRVRVRDTLDANLNPSTFHVTGSSHPMTYTIGGSGDLQFTFDNIMLPDSNSDEPHSHGFVKYAVTPKVSLPSGLHIHNTASIYFDFNQPVATNTTVNTIVIAGIDILEKANDGTFIYPNPATKSFKIFNPASSIESVEITDAHGKILVSRLCSKDGNEIDASQLHSGIYFVKLKTAKGIIVKKVVVF